MNEANRKSAINIYLGLLYTDSTSEGALSLVKETIEKINQLSEGALSDEQKVLAYLGVSFLTNDVDELNEIHNHLTKYDSDLIASCSINILSVIKRLNIEDCKIAIIEKIYLSYG